jgi:hypothetical protein
MAPGNFCSGGLMRQVTLTDAVIDRGTTALSRAFDSVRTDVGFRGRTPTDWSLRSFLEDPGVQQPMAAQDFNMPEMPETNRAAKGLMDDGHTKQATGGRTR